MKKKEHRKSESDSVHRSTPAPGPILARKPRAWADVAVGMNNGFERGHAGYIRLNIHNASLRRAWGATNTVHELRRMRAHARARFARRGATLLHLARVARARARAFASVTKPKPSRQPWRSRQRIAGSQTGTLKSNWRFRVFNEYHELRYSGIRSPRCGFRSQSGF